MGGTETRVLGDLYLLKADIPLFYQQLYFSSVHQFLIAMFNYYHESSFLMQELFYYIILMDLLALMNKDRN